jgi:peptide/nickel transport system permease protein
MIRFMARRISLVLLTIVATSIIVFALTQLLPGDVARLILGREVSPDRVAAFNAQFGLDLPAHEQYLRWLGNFLAGDWGRSFAAGNPQVRPIVLERLGNSLILAAMTLTISIPLGILLGIITALRANTWVDSVISAATLSVVGLPEFVTGILLVNVFALSLGWFEATSLIRPGYSPGDWLRILTLPAITASFVLVGYITRLTRAGMLEELQKVYVRTAVLKGLPWSQVVVGHVLRNALMPTVTVIAISIGWLIGGMVVIENVYNYPGLGSELVRAVEQKNLPLIQSITMVIVVMFTLSNLAADIVYALLNPRIRLA